MERPSIDRYVFILPSPAFGIPTRPLRGILRRRVLTRARCGQGSCLRGGRPRRRSAYSRVPGLNPTGDLPESQYTHDRCDTYGADTFRTQQPRQSLRQSTGQRSHCHTCTETHEREGTEETSCDHGGEAVGVVRKSQIPSEAEPGTPNATEQGPGDAHDPQPCTATLHRASLERRNRSSVLRACAR